MRTERECLEDAAHFLAESRAICAGMSPREQAEAAYQPGGPSVDEIEDRIRIKRGLAPLHQAKSA